MSLNELLNIKVQENPDSLLKLLVKVAVLSIVVAVVLCSYGFYKVFSGFVIKSAEVNSVQLCRALIEEQRDLMFLQTPDKPEVLALHDAGTTSFDSSLRNFLAPFNIIKVKIYNADKKIIYCTDPTLTGKVDDNNARLKNALGGTVDAKMVKKDKARDMADEPLLDVDVVETYVPILSQDNRVLGSFEVYMNITGYRDQIRRGAVITTSLLVLVLTAVFGFSYQLIRGGTGQLKAAQSQLELVAITDSLTGIYNRRYLMTRGEGEFERFRRGITPLSCIMLDLDHFKRVNDTKGHAAGDCVLKELANRLKNSVRPYDIVGRFGGEEFLVLLPDTNFTQSLVVANRICDLIRASSFEIGGGLLPVTASMGVAECRDGDCELNDMIKRADEGLYKAKNEGRNRVSWV